MYIARYLSEILGNISEYKTGNIKNDGFYSYIDEIKLYLMTTE